MTPRPSLGPLGQDSCVAVVGGGPGGVATALALKDLARKNGRSVRVMLFEGKKFEGEQHFNQCVGVLSPPIDLIVEESLGVRFPRHLVQREIVGYVLHSRRRSILLESDDPPAYSVRRVQFDAYMLEQARCRGVEVVSSRVTDLEFYPDTVILYSESGNCEAAVVVGAFGSDDGTAAIFERATPYRAPRFLSSIVTKIHPPAASMSGFGNRIHAYLPAHPAIEFGAITPKGNHLTINIAGQRIDASAMDQFLQVPEVSSQLPALHDAQRDGDLTFFKGRFPISLARAFYGDRYVIVGDAAGLVRPFKGKGVNSAMLTGIRAARSIFSEGISNEAFRNYHRACGDITGDLPYGRAMRAVAISLGRWGLLDTVLRLAVQDARMNRALFGAVSAHQTYREIVLDMLRPGWLIRMAAMALSARGKGEPDHRLRT
jgi:flavin-dependent dehydrogenase